jgi:hypothetical protein
MWKYSENAHVYMPQLPRNITMIQVKQFLKIRVFCCHNFCTSQFICEIIFNFSIMTLVTVGFSRRTQLHGVR